MRAEFEGVLGFVAAKPAGPFVEGAFADIPGGEIGAGMEPEPVHGALQMRLGGRHADLEGVGDFLVLFAAGDEADDFKLSRGEVHLTLSIHPDNHMK